jgi:DNA-binding CsgD family transcriptional regulator
MEQVVNVEWHYGSKLPAAPPLGEIYIPEFRREQMPPGFSAEVLQQCIPWGVLIVDQQRRILFANRRGRLFIEAGGGLEERSGRLRAERANIDRSLGELVQKAAAASPTSIWQAETVGVPDDQGQTRYALKVIRCRTDQGEAAALLLITDLLSSIHVSREAVGTVFHLSDREAEFAELFGSGLRIDAIARRMGIAVNTARVHLRNVFAKTGCASQIELARTFAHMP